MMRDAHGDRRKAPASTHPHIPVPTGRRGRVRPNAHHYPIPSSKFIRAKYGCCIFYHRLVQ